MYPLTARATAPGRFCGGWIFTVTLQEAGIVMKAVHYVLWLRKRTGHKYSERKQVGYAKNDCSYIG